MLQYLGATLPQALPGWHSGHPPGVTGTPSLLQGKSPLSAKYHLLLKNDSKTPIYICGIPSGREKCFLPTWLMFLSTLSCTLARALGITFCWSQAAGFLTPNPKRVVSSTPGIFQRQPEAQPSPQGGVTNVQLGWLSRGTGKPSCSCRVQPPPQGTTLLTPKMKWTLWRLAAVNDPIRGYLTTKTVLAWLKRRGPRKYAFADSSRCSIKPPPQPNPTTSRFHPLGNHHFSRACIQILCPWHRKTEQRQMCNVEIHYALFTCVTISFTN